MLNPTAVVGIAREIHDIYLRRPSPVIEDYDQRVLDILNRSFTKAMRVAQLEANYYRLSASQALEYAFDDSALIYEEEPALTGLERKFR